MCKIPWPFQYVLNSFSLTGKCSPIFQVFKSKWWPQSEMPRQYFEIQSCFVFLLFEFFVQEVLTWFCFRIFEWICFLLEYCYWVSLMARFFTTFVQLFCPKTPNISMVYCLKPSSFIVFICFVFTISFTCTCVIV